MRTLGSHADFAKIITQIGPAFAWLLGRIAAPGSVRPSTVIDLLYPLPSNDCFSRRPVGGLRQRGCCDPSAGKGLLEPHRDQLLNQWHRKRLAGTEAQGPRRG
jgi:hypothetical protein